MIKHYCDLCGAPAVEKVGITSHTRHLPALAWFGSKMTRGGISPTNGTWTPAYTVAVSFGAENLSENNHREHVPDLCGKCMAGLLHDLIQKIELAAVVPINDAR